MRLISVTYINKFPTIQGMLTQLFVCLEAGVFDNSMSKKIIALGLTSLLSLPTASMPASVVQVLPHAFEAVVKVRLSLIFIIVSGQHFWSRLQTHAFDDAVVKVSLSTLTRV